MVHTFLWSGPTSAANHFSLRVEPKSVLHFLGGLTVNRGRHNTIPHPSDALRRDQSDIFVPPCDEVADSQDLVRHSTGHSGQCPFCGSLQAVRRRSPAGRLVVNDDTPDPSQTK